MVWRPLTHLSRRRQASGKSPRWGRVCCWETGVLWGAVLPWGACLLEGCSSPHVPQTENVPASWCHLSQTPAAGPPFLRVPCLQLWHPALVPEEAFRTYFDNKEENFQIWSCPSVPASVSPAPPVARQMPLAGWKRVRDSPDQREAPTPPPSGSSQRCVLCSHWGSLLHEEKDPWGLQGGASLVPCVFPSSVAVPDSPLLAAWQKMQMRCPFPAFSFVSVVSGIFSRVPTPELYQSSAQTDQNIQSRERAWKSAGSVA